METFLLAVTLILLVGRTFGLAVKRIGINSMLGEVLAGLVLGPLALYLTAGELGITPTRELEVMSEIGILMIMILSGVVTDVHAFRSHRVDSILVGAGGVVVSFLIVFLPLYFLFSVTLAASLFIAAILSNTAIEICSWLLKDSKSADIKAIVIGASFVDDIMAVFIIGVVSSLIFHNTVPTVSDLLILSAKVGIFLFVVLIFGDKVFGYVSKRYIHRSDRLVFTATMITALSLAVVARLVGLHEVIGAYMGGLIVAKWYSNPDPMLKRSLLRSELVDDLEPQLEGLFGPLFFVYIGLTMPFSQVDITAQLIGFIVLIFVLAVLGKVIGCGATAYMRGVSRRGSMLIGVSMVGRGALEMVLLKYGMEAGVINASQFFSIVTVTLLTIAFTPVLYMLVDRHTS